MQEEQMNIYRKVALANEFMYNLDKNYIDGSSQIKHTKLRNLCSSLMNELYDFACDYKDIPEVLDIGAGEGYVTLSFLEKGAKVTAVDISKNQLEKLNKKCRKYDKNLQIYQQDILKALKLLKSQGKQFDIIVANSFLHHIPDYLGLIRSAVPILSPHGQFFFFSRPLTL